MDPLFTASSALGMVALSEPIRTAFRHITKLIEQLSSSHPSLSPELEELSTNLKLLPIALQHYEHQFQSSSDSRSAEMEALLLQQLLKELQDIEEMLKRLPKSKGRLVFKVFSYKNLRDAVLRVEELLRSLTMLTQAKMLSSVRQTTLEISSISQTTIQVSRDMDNLLSMSMKLGDEKSGSGFSDIWDWVNVPDYEKLHQHYRTRRLSGTCQWFIQDSTLNAWYHGGKEALWCLGAEGVVESRHTIANLLPNRCATRSFSIASRSTS